MKKRLVWLTAVLMLTGVSCAAPSSSTETAPEAEAATETATETETEATNETETENVPASEAEPARTFEAGQEMGIAQFNPLEPGETIAILHTNKGDIKMRFLEEQAPKAVENFVTHAKDGYYNGVIFHRVISDFMIQGGDPEGTGMGGESIWGAPFENEVSADARHFRGAVSMANAGPDTNGSQFFIVQAGPMGAELDALADRADEVHTVTTDGKEWTVGETFPANVIDQYKELGGAHYLDLGYSVFGQVYEGMDVVDAIAAVETEGDRPVSDIVIESVEITTY